MDTSSHLLIIAALDFITSTLALFFHKYTALNKKQLGIIVSKVLQCNFIYSTGGHTV